MYNIVGRDNLEAVNELATECLVLIHRLKKDHNTEIVIDKEFIEKIAQGYLYMYNKSIEHSVMPSPKLKPHLFNEIVQ